MPGGAGGSVVGAVELRSTNFRDNGRAVLLTAVCNQNSATLVSFPRIEL